MAFIRTVRGDIGPGELGACYGHEHVLCAPAEDDRDLTLDSEAAAIQELSRFREAGGRGLVEMSPADYGRDAEGLRRVSEATGVHIVAATGHHKEKYSGAWAHGRTVEELAERFIGDILVGMDGTPVRAGVIKAASSLDRITADEEKVFRAAALAQGATGAAISTHTEVGSMGLEQVALLREAGVAPGRILIGHLDRRLEWDYHLALARTGVYLGYDQISKEKYAPDSRRVEFILRLAAEGHGRQILLAGDLARKSYWPAYGQAQGAGGPGLTDILWRFVPWLRAEGLGEETLQAILVDNPRRLLTFVQ